MNVSAAIIAVSVVVIALELRHITRATVPPPSPPDDLERLYAAPDRYCPACGSWLSGDALWCSDKCQGAWLA